MSKSEMKIMVFTLLDVKGFTLRSCHTDEQ